jgi:hypothetical protein
MLESLRGLGYSAATALADIIDNSISAGATRVDIIFAWRGPATTVSVLDDGRGMEDPDLERAMRLGHTSPLDHRAPQDLGRFGLGLKTASFSQCRRLTVASKKTGQVSCLRWDLDLLASRPDGGWYLLEGPADGSEDLLAPLNSVTHGTLVLWESLDRVVTPGFDDRNFLDLVDRVEQHLATVFHRILTDRTRPFRITINARQISARDPFLTDHPATWSSPIERIAATGAQVEVQCHVLPHSDRLATADRRNAGGEEGWTAHQGFYVYRNRRLLVEGSWLGLGRGRPWTKEEALRLARIRIDIPNSADAEWKIDIRKSTARPPVWIRERLTRLAEDTRLRARRIFAHRGTATKQSTGSPVQPAWIADHSRGRICYRINAEHPAVIDLLAQAGAFDGDLRAVFQLIESTIPVQRIWLDASEAQESSSDGKSDDRSEGIAAILSVMYRSMILRKGLSSAAARERLLHAEPFSEHPELVAALPDLQTDPETSHGDRRE